MDKPRILLMDIERRPPRAVVYPWDIHKPVFVRLEDIQEFDATICFTAKWLGKKQVIFDSLQHSSPKQMAEHVWKLLDEADAVIHYNGKRFDVPVLNWDFITNDLPPPSPFRQIDLYQTVRSKFKIISRKLGYVLERLEMKGKLDMGGMEALIACGYDNCPKAWKKMEAYNKRDVTELEPLYYKLLPWIDNHPNMNLFKAADMPACCTNCGSAAIKKDGRILTTNNVIRQRYQCTKCDKTMAGEIIKSGMALKGAA